MGVVKQQDVVKQPGVFNQKWYTFTLEEQCPGLPGYQTMELQSFPHVKSGHDEFSFFPMHQRDDLEFMYKLVTVRIKNPAYKKSDPPQTEEEKEMERHVSEFEKQIAEDDNLARLQAKLKLGVRRNISLDLLPEIFKFYIAEMRNWIKYEKKQFGVDLLEKVESDAIKSVYPVEISDKRDHWIRYRKGVYGYNRDVDEIRRRIKRVAGLMGAGSYLYKPTRIGGHMFQLSDYKSYVDFVRMAIYRDACTKFDLGIRKPGNNPHLLNV